MKDNLNYLKNNLNLCDYTLLQVTNDKFLIFKPFYKYTKCIYISVLNKHIEVKIDKVFDSEIYPEYIERLMITKKYFNNICDSLKYIQSIIII